MSVRQLSRSIERSFSLGQKIGEGGYRVVYDLGDGRCAKVLKKKRRKDYGSIQIYYPMQFYLLFKFGINDFNQFEFHNYEMLMDTLPPDAHRYFAHIYDVIPSNGTSASIEETIRNQDGSVAPTIDQFGPVADAGFWEALDYLREVFIDRKVPMFNSWEDNILVKRENDGLVPVFFDYKRVGYQTYPFQFWLRFSSQQKRKMERKFDRLERYRVRS